MYYLMSINFGKQKENNETFALLTATSEADARQQASRIFSQICDEVTAKRNHISFELNFVSQEKHEELLAECLHRQRGTAEFLGAAMVLNGSSEVEALTDEQEKNAIRLIVEPQAFPLEYGEARSKLMIHLDIEVEGYEDESGDEWDEEEKENMQLDLLPEMYEALSGELPPRFSGSLYGGKA